MYLCRKRERERDTRYSVQEKTKPKMHSVLVARRWDEHLRVWRQKQFICSVLTLEIIIIISLRVVSCEWHGCIACMQPYDAKLQKRCIHSIYFCVYFAFCSLFYSHWIHCVAHFRLFFAGSAFARAIQLKCTRDISVDFFHLLLLLRQFRFTSSTFASSSHLSSIRMCRTETRMGFRFNANGTQKHLYSGDHFTAPNKYLDPRLLGGDSVMAGPAHFEHLSQR